MPSPLRRWRPLIALALVWLIVMWFYLDGTNYYGGDSAPYEYDESIIPRLMKRPDDQYPVKSIIPLPTQRPSVPIPSVQKSPPPREDAAEKRLRIQRQSAVKESFIHSWKGYKEHAWLHDEVAPLTSRSKDTFGGWAATLVDALDTLWIMGLKDEFKAAVKACGEIDFTFTIATSINVFETTIRYLGGFLAAYEISEKQYPLLLEKATQIGEILLGAFDTPNRMPISRWEWQV
jgi:hypothetical protein